MVRPAVIIVPTQTKCFEIKKPHAKVGAEVI